VVLDLSSVVSTTKVTTTTEDDMYSLYLYSGLAQEHINDLRRDADQARLARRARRRRQSQARDGATAYRSTRPATAR
jgi:hypothetical protein